MWSRMFESQVPTPRKLSVFKIRGLIFLDVKGWVLPGNWPCALQVYMALDVVLHGVSAARLANILGTFHGESVSNMVTSATEIENKARGADSWNQIKPHSLDRLSNIEVCIFYKDHDVGFSSMIFVFCGVCSPLSCASLEFNDLWLVTKSGPLNKYHIVYVVKLHLNYLCWKADWEVND